MSVDKALRKQSINLESPPRLYCPECLNATLVFIVRSVIKFNDQHTRSCAEQEDLDPLDYESSGPFRVDIACGDRECQMKGTAVGTFTSQLYRELNPSLRTEYTTDVAYSLQWISPAPYIFIPPTSTPKSLLDLLEQAFALFWPDPPACASRLRVLVERILDHLGARKTKVGANGNRIRLTLHQRIEQLKPTDRSLHNLLLAAKWLGNDGAHQSSLCREDAIDALILVASALELKFDESTKRTQALASKINRHKKPLSRHRKK